MCRFDHDGPRHEFGTDPECLACQMECHCRQAAPGQTLCVACQEGRYDVRVVAGPLDYLRG